MTPVDCINLHDHAARAAAVMDPAVAAYVDGGAADELTMKANLQGWRELPLHPRVLRPLAGGHTRCTLLGREHPHPLLVAPMALQRLVHPDGERAVALAAAALQAGLVLSQQSSTPAAEVAAVHRSEPGGGPLWMQLYLCGDRGRDLQAVRQAEAQGFEALVLSVDAPVQGARDRQRRARFSVPAGLSTGYPHRAPEAGATGLCAGWVEQATTWDDIAWLKTQTTLPLLLKGVTHPGDARQAQAMQLAGLIVSNHGGRTLDTLPATADLLPAVADAVGGTMTLLVDGGLRRGTDVLKALALGADAVLVGRPVLHGLAHAGAAGVAQVLRLLRDELEMAMALCGCRTLRDIGPACLGRRGVRR